MKTEIFIEGKKPSFTLTPEMAKNIAPPSAEEQTEPNVNSNVGEAEDKNFGKLFLCDPSWYETLEDEEDSVRLHVYDALFKYRLTGEVPELSAVEKVYFKFMTHAVDRFDKGKKEHDKETSRVRSINGKKGAEARWGKEKMANDGKNGHTIPIHTIPSPSSMCIVNNTSSNADASEAAEEAQPSVSTNVASIQDYYNSQVSLRGAHLRQSKGLTKKRRQAIGARLKEYGVEKVKECVDKAVASHFLNYTMQGGPADLGWIMSPDHFINVLEGKYDQKSTFASASSHSVIDTKNVNSKWDERRWTT